jgi:cob(I)alamin adenosyltransferase
MPATVPVTFTFGPLVLTGTMDITALMERIMSVLSDKLAELDTHLTTAETRVSATNAGLKQQITDLQSQLAALQAQVAAGEATPADLAKIDELESRLDALDQASPPTPAP